MVEAASIEWLASRDIPRQAVRDLLVDMLFEMLMLEEWEVALHEYDQTTRVVRIASAHPPASPHSQLITHFWASVAHEIDELKLRPYDLTLAPQELCLFGFDGLLDNTTGDCTFP